MDSREFYSPGKKRGYLIHVPKGVCAKQMQQALQVEIQQLQPYRLQSSAIQQSSHSLNENRKFTEEMGDRSIKK